MWADPVLCLTDCSSTRSHSSSSIRLSRGYINLSAILMKPEILFKNLRQDDANFCEKPTLSTDCPQLSLAEIHLTDHLCSSQRSGSSSETVQYMSALALVLDWDLLANWQSNHAISVYKRAYISYKHIIHAHLSV